MEGKRELDEPRGGVVAGHKASVTWSGEPVFKAQILSVAKEMVCNVEEGENEICFTFSCATLSELRKAVDSFLERCALIQNN
ncbi:MAG: hypothetical protein HOA04_07965 [Euryarchaeota archaeon]|nr:hypothetical protein [Euryarchaeota archaeon]